MISKVLQLVSEMINGAWVLMAISLAIMSIVYLRHEFLARGVQRPWTSGMRVALAMAILSIGVGLSHLPIWEWRHFNSHERFGEWRAGVMALGAFIGSTGFLFANREISRQLYGDAPWMSTAAIVVMFLVATATFHQW
jgi:hypothetical protein